MTCFSVGAMDLDWSVATTDVRGAEEAAAGVRYRLASHHREHHCSRSQCGELLCHHTCVSLGLGWSRDQRGLVPVVYVPVASSHLLYSSTIQQVRMYSTMSSLFIIAVVDDKSSCIFTMSL